MRTRLEEIFGNCKFSNKCLCDTKNSFELTSKEIFFLYDVGGNSEKPVEIVSADQDFQLTVHNIELMEICLVKLDKCLISQELSKCECLLFNDSKFFFIEIKSSSNGSRGNRRKKAIEQLANTIELLATNGVDFSNLQTNAIICFKSTEPRITNATVNTSKAKFYELYKIVLQERNFIEF